jgi:hypothetical protein
MRINAALAMSVLLALTSTGGAAKPKDLFCPNLKKAVTAASEKPAFKSLYGPVVGSFDLRATVALPGFTDCRIEGYKFRRPSFSCARKVATSPEAQALMARTRTQIESCLGGTMFKDRDRSMQPWVLRKTALEYPFAYVNVLNETEVVIGYASDYIP